MASNTNLTSTIITREALRILHQKLNFVGNLKREYDSRFANSGAKIGDTLQIRRPVQYTTRTGKSLSVQDSVEKKVDLTVGTQKGVDIEFDSDELTLDIDNFSERYLEPAMAQLAASIEADAFSMYKDVYSHVDNSGSSQAFADLLKARKKLTDNLTPMSNRNLILNTQANNDVVDALKGLFQDSTQIAQQYRDGRVGVTAGFGDIWENTLLPRHTVGGQDGNYQTNGSTQTGSTLTVDTGTGTINKGDVFTIAGVNRVHPETKEDTGELQQFVATSDFAGGSGDVSISPEIIASGAYQNVSNSAADNSALTFIGTASTAHDMSLAFHRDAFAFATADLVMPQGVDFAAREIYDGISMRIVRQYDINNDNYPCRIDVLYGYKTIRPELACRLAAN
jgi:hypothetical protein